MGILLAFLPFIVFVVLERLVGVTPGLIAAAVTSAVLITRDLLRRKGFKVLEAGTFVLFTGLAVYASFGAPAWSIIAVRLRVDAGLLLIVLISLAIRQPFTLAYAREQVAQEYWSTPEFLRTNYIITAVWALAFAVMVAAEAAILYVPAVSQRVGVWVTILAIIGAYKFTDWYPNRQKVA